MKHMQKRLRDEELRILRGEIEVDEADLDRADADLDSSSSGDSPQQSHQPAAGFVSAPAQRAMHTTDKGQQPQPASSRILCTVHDNHLAAF